MPTPVDDVFLSARQVTTRYGVSKMTLWRWLHDADMKFPEPLQIQRLRYWRASDLVAWERTLARKSTAPDAAKAVAP